MSDLVEIVVGLLGATVLATTTGVALSARWVGRRNRVDPSVPSGAPRTWLVSPSPAANLHRRLRQASLLVIAATGADLSRPARRRRRGRGAERGATAGPLDTAGREVVARAVLIDSRLVSAARSGRHWRSRRVGELRREVHQLEATAARIADLSIDLRHHLDRVTAVPGPDPVAADLDGFEAALGELGVRRRSG